jgi:thiamine phosphate synthase YjbQ (UPF0047 family)
MGELGIPSSRKSGLLGIAVNNGAMVQFLGKGISLTYASAALLVADADGLVEKDSLNSLSDMVPNNLGYACSQSSICSLSCVKSAAAGCPKAGRGTLELGTMQYMGYCELDGSQSQKFVLEVVGR